MIIHYKDFTVNIINENNYTFDSADNVLPYEAEYGSLNHLHSNKHGIRILRDEHEISSAIICANGVGTSVHETSFIIKNDSLYICCGEQIFSLNIPSLTLNWNKEVDTATCFEIYEFENDFIIHGELEITRLTETGEIKWHFSARDIFVNINGKKEFEIIGNTIKLVDWGNYEYILDGDGKEVQ
jgi:hypothetical protein